MVGLHLNSHRHNCDDTLANPFFFFSVSQKTLGISKMDIYFCPFLKSSKKIEPNFPSFYIINRPTYLKTPSRTNNVMHTPSTLSTFHSWLVAHHEEVAYVAGVLDKEVVVCVYKDAGASIAQLVARLTVFEPRQKLTVLIYHIRLAIRPFFVFQLEPVAPAHTLSVIIPVNLGQFLVEGHYVKGQVLIWFNGIERQLDVGRGIV